MTLSTALTLLRTYNRWRRESGELDMPNPREVGEALDVVIAHFDSMDQFNPLAHEQTR